MAYIPIINRFIISAVILDNSGGNGAIDVSKYLKKMAVKKNFVENVFPLFSLNFESPENIRNIVRDNNCDISISVSMYNADENNSNNDTDSSAIYPSEKIIETILRIYEKPYETNDNDSDENYDDNTLDTSAGAAAPFIKFSVSCVPKRDVDRNASIVNTVFSNANSSEMVVKILTDNFSISNMYTDIDESTVDKSRYKSAIIPPQTPISAIKYIDSTYGVYKYGAMSLFIDTDKTYLFNHYNTSRVYNRSFVYEHVDGTALNNTINLPQLDTEEQRMVYRNSSAPIYYNADLIVLNNIGTHTSYYSYSSDFDIVIRSNKKDGVLNKNRVFWNPSRSISNETSFDISNRKSEAIPIYLSNINPEYFKPDTNMRIISKHENISGDYSILELSYVFSTRNSYDFGNTVAMSLIKIK